MSRIDDLIAEYCPDGVKHQTLGEIGEFIRGNGIQKRDFQDSGFGCIHYGQIYTYYGLFADHTKSFIDPNLAEKRKKAYKGDLVIATTSENEEDVCKACAWLGEEPIAISGDAYIFRHHQNPKYISYCFQSELFQSQKKKGSVRPRLTRKACSPKTRLFDCAERSNKRVEISLLQRQIDDSVQMCKQAFF